MPREQLLVEGGGVVASSVRWARSPLERARGLIGSPSFGAMILVGARQVHTFGMRAPIDVVFCDSRWNVVHVVTDMPPRRVTRWVRSARFVVEIPSSASAAKVRAGDRLRVET